MNSFTNEYTGILICLLLGGASAWTQYGDQLLLTNQTAGNHSDAESQCGALGGLVVSPVWASIQAAVIDAAITLYPDQVFWTGFKRKTNETWTSAFYHASMNMLPWGYGVSSADPGDCLAMEVLPTGITFHPDDCTTSLGVICHLIAGNHFETNQTEYFFPYHANLTGKSVVNEDECRGNCLTDMGCIGYNYTSVTSQCTTFTSLPTFDITDFTLYSGGINDTLCCTPDGIVVLECCMFNGTARDPDCDTPYVASMDNVTQCLLLSTDVIIPHWSFVVTERKVGCLVPEDPANGTITAPSSTGVNATIYDFDCDSGFSRSTYMNYTCGADFRWSGTPFCEHKAERCPAGWAQYGFYCYLVTEEPLVWDDQLTACRQHNAFPLYMESDKEVDFMNRLLTFQANQTFWTGVTNTEGYFRFAHNHDIAEDLRWFEEKSNDRGCITLQRTVEGNDLGEFYNNVTLCNDSLPYICKMGSSTVGGKCDRSVACRGFARCSSYWGVCRCQTDFHSQIVGDPGDNMTYCSTRWKGNGDYLVLETEISVPWPVAVSLCMDNGGSLYTPVTSDLQQVGLDRIWTMGSGKTSWTALSTVAGEDSRILATGFVPYDVVEYESLAWRLPPEFGQNGTASCIATEITELGARLFAFPCKRRYMATCFKYNDSTFSPFVPTDNSGLTSVLSLERVNSVERCSLECLTKSWCLSFTFTNSTDFCHLYNTTGTGTIPDTYIEVHRKISACSQPFLPWHGFPVVDGGNAVGAERQYDCDSIYMLPVNSYNDTITCGANGRWGQIPMCVTTFPKCPIGWEQYQTACYYMSDNRVQSWAYQTWGQAEQSCTSMDAFLLQVHNRDELDFVSKMLDVNCYQDFWTGGNDQLIPSVFSWSTNDYAEMPYLPFPSRADGLVPEPYDDLPSCLALTSIFNDTDLQTSFLVEKTCTRYHRYLCFKKLLPIGIYNCSQYGENSCAINSHCVDEKCVCYDGFFQIGADGDSTTTCEPIVPVGSTGCFIEHHGNIDNLCPNSSVCTHGTCRCSAETFQNGPDGSFSTLCIEDMPTCPDNNWVYYKNHCYQVFMNTFRDIVRNPKPPIAADYCCGERNAHLATIHSQADNDFLMILGSSRTTRWVGYKYKTKTSELIAVDNSTVDFTLFGYTNANITNDYCIYMDEVGYWRQSDCNNYEVPDVTCERTARCKVLPMVVNGSYSSTLQAEVGTTYVYTCDSGFIMDDSHSGAVTCLEEGRESLWTEPPTCSSLLETIFDLYTNPNTLYGLQLNSLEQSRDFLCAENCYNNQDCSVFVFNPVTQLCETYTNKSESSLTGLVSLPNHEIWTRNYGYCGPVPHVDRTSYNVNGTVPGSKVKYRCQGHYRIDRTTPDILSCNVKAVWDQHQLPVCISRFERENDVFPMGYRDGKTVYKIYSIGDCELVCQEETQFRCVRCAYYKGVCYLFDTHHHGNRGDYNMESGAISSQLIDGDLEEFDLWYHQTVNIEDGEILLATDGKSAEMCAQDCIYLNCSFFTYHRLNLTCAVFGGNIPTLTPMSSDPDIQLYIRRYGCAAPPTVTNARVELVLQQVHGSYSVGDRVHVECLVAGEEIVSGHNGDIECLKTGQWSSPPSCRNLCPDGWYMKEYMCYKLYDNSRTFWEAYDACHVEDAGLVNLQSVTELEATLIDIWNWTGAASMSYWIGAYTDLSLWKWSERLAGDVQSVLLSLPSPNHTEHLGVTVYLPGGTINAVLVTDTNPFICRKAAAKLVCPSGWEKYQTYCLKVFNDSARNYTDAMAACQAENSTLASVPEVYTPDVIGHLVAAAGESSAYVGLHKPVDGMYKLVDGARLLYGYPLTTEASSDHLLEKCGTVGQDYVLAASSCTPLLPFVCQKHLDEFGEPTDFSNLPCSTDHFCNDTNLVCAQWKDKSTTLSPKCVGIDCPQPWVYINGRCYRHFSQPVIYTDSVLKCVAEGGELFVPNDMMENYNIFFWLRSLQHIPSNVFIGIEKIMGPTHISTDTRKTPAFIHTATGSSSYILHVHNKNRGSWGGTAVDVMFTTLCEKDPTPKQSYDYLYEGCYTEESNEEIRDLSERTLVDVTMTVDLCATHCKGHGYKYCGIQDGDTCRCGNSRGRHGRLATDSCNIGCPGNNSQLCGGNSIIAVYRVTGSACVESMASHPFDPSVCYSSVNNSISYSGGIIDCLLQGSYSHSKGELLSMETPYVEEAAYHQVLRSFLRPSTSNGTEAVISLAWIGLNQLKEKINFMWESGVEVNWTLLTGANSHNFWQQGVIANLSHHGLWEEIYTFLDTFPYACQVVDGSQKIFGDGIQHRYTSTGTLQTVREGEFRSAREFGYGCLLNRARCSKGFTITLKVKVTDLMSNHHILSTGDCMTDLIGSTGFCLSFHTASQSIVVVDIQNNTCRRLEVLLTPGQDQTNLVLYFINETDVYLYMDGDYKGQLSEYPVIQFLGRIKNEQIDINYQHTNEIVIENVTFIAGPPDQVLLELLTDNSSLPTSAPTHQIWKDFSLWGLDLPHWGSPGVDGDGLSLSLKAFTYDLGQTTKDWLSNPTDSFTLAAWIKVPPGLKENIDLVTFGGGYETLFSMSYNATVGNLQYFVATTGTSYSNTFSLAFSEWQHFTLTFSMGYFSVYVNGDLVGSLGKWTAVTGQGGNYTVQVYTGSAMCPLGWKKNGLSCYMKGQAASTDYWEQEDYCQQLGGHLVTVDTGQEMEFLETYLYGSDTVYTGVFDQLQYPNSQRRWFDTRGYRHDDKFFTDPTPTSQYENFVSLYFDPSFNMSIPMISGNVVQNLSALGNTTNTTTVDDSFSGVTACEINLSGKPSRRQMSQRCSEGWYYLYDQCYKMTTQTMNGMQAFLECNKDRAILPQITTSAKQIYLSNWIRSTRTEATVYLGLQKRQPLAGNASFLWNDMRPLPFTYWGSVPGMDSGSECVVMNCTRSTTSCLWEPVTCDSLYLALCEKPADTVCGPGWRLYKDKCVSTLNVTSAAEGWASCVTSASVPLSLLTKADTDEYLYTFALGSSTCLTAGILDTSGNYISNSPDMLTSSHQCVGLDASGPIQQPCDNYDCVVCEHYVDGGVSLDNIHIKAEVLDDIAVENLYLQEAYMRITYMWDMESYNGTTVEGSRSVDNHTLQYCVVELQIDTKASITTDPTMGNVLQITESLAGAVYNLSQFDVCLQNIINCKQGITVMFWITGTNISSCVLVDTTTSQDGSTGVKIWVDNSGKRMYAAIMELNYVWEGWIWVVTQDWVHIAVTWQRNVGLRFHTNFRHVYTVPKRTILPVFSPESVPSSNLSIGLCTNSVLLLLDDLEVYNYALESREVLELQKTQDIEKVIDFNIAMSTTNVNLEKNGSLTSIAWRNSLFETIIRVDNPAGQSPAMYSNQLPHCFTRADLCSGPFTTSLWLRPMDMETDQVFLTAGTIMDLEMTSLKIWYDSYVDTYILEVFYDKIHFTIQFYLTLYKWSYLVINGDLTNSELHLYVNGQLAVTTTTVFVVDRMSPQYDVTFIYVGVVGTFDIDDIRHFPSTKQAQDLYALKSCHEYELAGFNGIQQLAIDLDPWDNIIGFSNSTCDLQDFQTFHFTMDKNETQTGLYNITLEDNNTNAMVFTEGVLNEAILLNTSGLVVNITSETCFGSVAHCYFGFTMAMWIRLQTDHLVASGDQVVVMRMGGNLTRNESGIAVVCANHTGQYQSDSALCSLVLVNHTVKWSTTFYVLYNSWSHLAITWNPYHTLNFYKNGHLISDLGEITTTEVIHGYSFVNQSETSFCIGCSLGNTGLAMAVDELYLLDMDMSKEDILKLYGIHHLCSKDWRYLFHTDRCYHFSSDSLTHYNGELTCQSSGGNLADEVDLLTHQLLGQMADLDGLTGQYFLNYKQLPREGTHALRVPDGSVRNFASFGMPSSTNTRMCGMLTRTSTWIWDNCNCNSVKKYMCQTKPWYAMAELLTLNHSTVSLSPDPLAGQWTGSVGYKRGVTLTSMTFNNTHIHQVFSDQCLVNHNFCHNGLTISFWLRICNTSMTEGKQTVLSTMTGDTMYGLAVYWENSTTLVVEMRTEHNFTRHSVFISECHWNNFVLSVDNATDVKLYVNGKETVAELTFNEIDTAVRILGEEVRVSVGTQFNGGDGLIAMLDNVTVLEHKVLDDIHLHKTVYENFPDFHLSFDNHSLVLPSSGVTTSSGWHGDCLTFNGNVSSQFEGYLYQDCLVAPAFCWEGFTLSLWLYPTTDTLNQGILSARRDYRGLAMAYYLSYEGLANHYWFIVQENNIAYNIPFQLYSQVWSNIILTWYINGSIILHVNSVDQSQSVSTNDVTTGNPPQPTTLTLGGISGYNDINADGFQGAIDEFWFRPRPLNSSSMLELYKNSTYVRTKFVESFETSPSPEDGRATPVEAVYMNGSSLVSGVDWVNLTTKLANQSTCVLDIDRCEHGFTISLYLQMSLENDTDQVIFTTGGHDPHGLGIALLYTAMNKSLPFRRYFEVTILQTSMEYRTWFNLQWWMWNLVTLTFHPMFGVKVYVDDVLSSMSDTGTVRSTAPTTTTQHLMFGDTPSQAAVMGRFAVDEFQILDRAKFDGDLWMQYVHTDLQDDGWTMWEDVTRDECHHICDNDTCSVFGFCDDREFGSCMVYHANVTSNFSENDIHHHPSCDLFTKIITPIKVQKYGCFPTSVESDLLQLLGPGDITSCIQACQDSVTDMRFAGFHLQCYCGLETAPLTITHNDYEVNPVCGYNDFLIYQLSGLRDFLNVTVPVTLLDITLDPGMAVLVDQVLSVTMVAGTELAFAGFSINGGDGRDTYYTGRNYTTLVYPNGGLYTLQIEALNEISWKKVSVPIYVLTSLEGVEIYSDNVTATDTLLNITVKVLGGNFVTCTLQYGDGSQNSVYHENTSEPFQFSHIYSQENTNLLNVSCTNNASVAGTSKTLISLHPIVNLTLLSPQCYQYGDVINITWLADKGSNTSVNLYYKNLTLLNEEYASLSIPQSLFVNQSVYQTTGIHTFNLTATNIVSMVLHQATSVNIGSELLFLTLNTSKQFVKVGEIFSCDLSALNISIADVFINFDDGTVDHFVVYHLLDYKYSVAHSFSSSGSFLIKTNASNCLNSVSNSSMVIAEHPVDVLSVSIITVADPFHLVKVNLTLVNVSHPTDAVCDIYFGDGASDTFDPLILVDGYINTMHNYTVNGFFTISIFCHNNVSSFLYNETVQVGSEIEKLSVDAASYLPLGMISTITTDIDAGSLVFYSVDFGDGSPLYNTTTPVTYPNGKVNITHVYTQISVYTLIVTATNSFGTVINNTETISIMEETRGLILYGDRISKISWPVEFTIRFLTFGTNTCIHFSPGDGSNYVFGGANCPLKPKYSGFIFTASSGNSLSITHSYSLADTYTVIVEAENEVSLEHAQMSVVILEFPCTFPKVTILGFSSNSSKPSNTYPSVALRLRALADTYCMPIQHVVFLWNISRPDGGSFNESAINMASLPYLYIPPASLRYGLYAINVTIYIDGFSFFNDTSVVYLYEEPTPLVLELEGGDQRTVLLGNSFNLDARKSLDLDYPIHKTWYDITWYCWMIGDTTKFDPNRHENSADLKSLEYCFSSLAIGAGENTTTVTIPGTDLQSASMKSVVAKMTQGGLVQWKAQDIIVIQNSAAMLSIKCIENCYSVVSASLPVRLKGECLTCTLYNRLDLTYTWRLYKIDDGKAYLIDYLDAWTYTGTSSANLAIKPGLLEVGESYEIQLLSGNDYTKRSFWVTWPPYNGKCSTNINIGTAFRSKFIVSCTDWLDEGVQKTRDVSVDKTYRRNFDFTFYVASNTSSEYKRTPFFRVLGSWATAPEMILGEGDPNNDYKVDLVVTIKDFYGSVITVTNTVQVMPPDYTLLEVTNCTEMLLYEAEKDMMGIIMLSNGLIHKLTQDINNNDNNLSHDVKVMTATIDRLSANENLIQDEVLAASTVDTLNSMLSLETTVTSLSRESKMKIGSSYQNIASSLETNFKLSMSSDEKQALAQDLLSGVVTFAQNTKYSTDCSSSDCDEQFKQGQYVVEFISITHNISAILLEGTVPGEEEIIISIPQGNTVMAVRRLETLEVFNSTLSLHGHPLAEVPDLSDVVNCEEHGHMDVEIMVGDNLYTTDASWTQVKTQTNAVALIVDGEVLQVADLVTPIRILSHPPILQGLNFTSVNLSSDSSLFYIQLSVNESYVTPLFVLQTPNQNVSLRYYLKVGIPPTSEDYDFSGPVTPLDLQDISGNGTRWQVIIQLSDPAIAMSLDTSSSNLLYLGLCSENEERTTALDIALYVLDCLFWEDTMKKWSRRGLLLGNVTNYAEAPCESTHLTTFGTNVFVPPNTIDFNTVWSKFSADNVAVISTVGGLLVVYFLVLLWVRRADKRDVSKWAIYPLCDNLSTDRYHYQMTVYTGMRQNSGTTSKVFFVVGGDDGDTEVRAVEDSQSRPLTRGSVNNYLLSVPFNLGNLTFLRIWHDNTGKGKDADWYLNMVLIKDLQNNQKYVFLCNQWLAVDKGDQQVEWLLPVATQSELSNFDHLFYTRTRQDLTDGHLWISVLSRPTQSVFTRVQRLSCCLSLLFLTMVTNAMWYGTMDTTQQQNVHLGPFTFSGQELITSIAGSLIVVPVSIIIITLFKKSERRRSKHADKMSEPKEEESNHINRMMSKRGLDQYCSDECSDEREDSVTTGVVDRMMSKRGLDQYCSDECSDEREGCVTPSVIDTALIQPFNTYNSWADFENRTSRLINSRKNQQKLSERGKKKKRNPLPFWCLYLSWILVVLSVLASGFFVILYSIEWGTEKSSRWVTAFFLSFVESVILIQPLKVVSVALILILVFKRVDDEDEEAYVNKIVSPEMMATNRLSSSYPAHRRPYQQNTSDYSQLESARKHRKRMNRLFNIGRELGAYIVYLVVVCILTYENRSKNAYPTYSHLENTFLKPPTKYRASFINISSAEYFWNWAHDILIPGLYSDGMYSGNDTADFQGYLSDNIHYRVGTPRLRQARVTPADCTIPREFKEFFKQCYPDYGLDTYDSKSYGEGWNTLSHSNTSQAWQYQDSLQLNGYPVVGTYDSYSGGGYVTTLGNTNQTAVATFDYLHDAGWIDRNTRAVIVEANIYNPNVNLFSVICLVLEFPASGSIIPFSQISPVVLYRYVGASALFLLIMDFIFVAFTLYYLYILIKKIKQEKCAFLKQFWNIIDLINMAFSITACVFYGMHFIMVELATSDFHRNKDAYLNLQYIVLWEALYGYMLAFLLFLSMLKLLLILRFNPKITQLSGTLKKAKGPISSFMVVFVLTFLAFAQFGYLVFGRVDRGYYTFIATLETLMSMLMMKMEIDNMILVNGLLGSLFVFLFVMVIVFILINMLLSMINDAFTEVRKDPSFLPDDPAMATFLLDQIKAFVLGYYKDSTDKGKKEKTKESKKDLEEKIDDLDLRLRTFLQVLHRDRI